MFPFWRRGKFSLFASDQKIFVLVSNKTLVWLLLATSSFQTSLPEQQKMKKQMAMEQKNILRKLNLTFEFRTDALLEEPKKSNGNHLTVFFFNSRGRLSFMLTISIYIFGWFFANRKQNKSFKMSQFKHYCIANVSPPGTFKTMFIFLFAPNNITCKPHSTVDIPVKS